MKFFFYYKNVKPSVYYLNLLEMMKNFTAFIAFVESFTGGGSKFTDNCHSLSIASWTNYFI